MELNTFINSFRLCIVIAFARIGTSEQNDLTTGIPLHRPTTRNVTCGSTLDLRDVQINTSNNLSVTVANITCDIVSRNGNSVKCQVAEGNEACGSVMTNGTVIVTDEIFCFVPNVTFYQVKHQYTLQSGGTKIQFMGRNLDGIQLPKFLIHGKEGQRYHLIDCKVHLWDNVMCKTPNMTNQVTNTSLLVNITTSCQSPQQPLKMNIVPDPEFHNFTQMTDFVSFYGRHIPVELKDEMSITIENVICNITEVSENYVQCDSSLVQEVAKIFLDLNRKKPSRNVTQLAASKYANLTLRVIIGNYQVSTILAVKVGRSEEGSNKLLSAIVSSIVLLVTVIAMFVIIAVIKLRKMSTIKQRNEQKFIRSLEQVLLTIIDKEKDKSNDRLIVNIDDLTLGKVLGSGNFGCVYEGVLKKDKEILKVAVKTIQDSTDKLVDLENFTREAMIMKNFHHPNVLELIGIAENFPGTPYVVLPYMDNGDLLTYVRKETLEISLHDVIKFGADIASGMAYLSSLKFVHRDLAARNCMLNSAFTVKVADFGLCRDIYEKGYYSSDNKKSLPIRWMALESVEHGAYSTKSDVWSFGIVLWELLTRGMMPYPGVDGWDIINFLRQRRLSRPYFCPLTLYAIMTSCWEFLPDRRPEFTSLTSELSSMIGRQKPPPVVFTRSDQSSDKLSSDDQTSRYHVLEPISTSTQDECHVIGQNGDDVTTPVVIDNIIIAVPKCYTVIQSGSVNYSN
ncbi:hypothetical protein Btru_066614 [Bulinus truncatus]|nr:hypothetical protein Btru_066614 [Bulinus truncatus]